MKIKLILGAGYGFETSITYDRELELEFEVTPQDLKNFFENVTEEMSTGDIIKALSCDQIKKIVEYAKEEL